MAGCCRGWQSTGCQAGENVSQSAGMGKYPPVSGINLTRADNEGASLVLILTPVSPLLHLNMQSYTTHQERIVSPFVTKLLDWTVPIIWVPAQWVVTVTDTALQSPQFLSSHLLSSSDIIWLPWAGLGRGWPRCHKHIYILWENWDSQTQSTRA